MSKGYPSASAEVADTLRIAGDEVERDIALYRIWILGALVVATVPVGFFPRSNLHAAKVAIGFESLYFFVSVALWAFVRRAGAPRWLRIGTLLLDLAAPALFFIWIQRFAPEFPSWVTYVVPTLLTAGLLINMLRNERLMAAIGAVAAAVVFLLMNQQTGGVHAAHFITAVVIAVSGGIGVAAAGRVRRDLETLARLQLLRRFLPPAAVENVLKNNPDAAVATGGEAVTVTMLVSDLRGFTQLSQYLPPGDVVSLLNRFHGAMLEQIHRHGGVLDKFMGDGALVVFGLERAGAWPLADQGAQAAVACAQDMIRALDQLNAQAPQVSPLRMGIGIHTGTVVAGNIGAPGRRLEFTVIEDAVNTASRIEGLTKELGRAVLVSQPTVDRLVGRTDLEALPPVLVKGKETPLSLFSLTVPTGPKVPLVPTLTPAPFPAAGDAGDFRVR